MKMVATFMTPAEAEVARLALSHEGIPCFLEGAEYVAMLWIDATAVGFIKLQVPEDEAERAAAILQKDAGASTAVPPRCCPVCKATSPGNFEICWSCGAPLADAVSQAADASLPSNAVSANAPGEAIDADVPQKPAGDTLVRRAFAATIVGIVYLPPFAQIYSLWILFKAAWQEQPMSSRWRKMFWLTAALDVAILYVIVSFCIFQAQFGIYNRPIAALVVFVVLSLFYFSGLIYQARKERDAA